jgi:hypothetical protein
MFACCVIKHLDIIEYILPSFVPRFVKPAANPISLEKIEEAFGYSVVVVVTELAHGMLDIVCFDKSRPIYACKL